MGKFRRPDHFIGKQGFFGNILSYNGIQQRLVRYYSYACEDTMIHSILFEALFQNTAPRKRFKQVKFVNINYLCTNKTQNDDEKDIHIFNLDCFIRLQKG